MKRRAHIAIVAFALLVHALVVASVVGQPLDVASAPARARSLIWPLHPDTTHRLGPAADFFGIYDAGGEPPSPNGIYENIGSPAHPPTIVRYGYPFRYLPVVAFTLGAALRCLPAHAAYIAWVAIVELVLMAAVITLRRATRDGRASTFVTCALLVSSPYFLELHMGQFTFVSNALALGGVALIASARSTHGRVAGACAWIAACLLKLVPIVTAPAVARERRGFAWVAAAIVSIVATSVPYFLGHADGWRAFTEVNTGGHMDGLDAGNHGLLYIVYRSFRLLGVDISRSVWTTMASVWQLALLGAMALVVFFARRASGVLGAAAMTIAFVLCYVHVWEHHYSATLLAGTVVLVCVTNADGGWSQRARICAAAIVMMALPTPFVLLDPHPDPNVWDPSTTWGALALLLPLCKVIPAIAMLAVAITSIARDGFSLRSPFVRCDPTSTSPMR